MSLILSGTDGLSDVDGSAATPAIRGTDANTGMFFPAADTIAFSEGGVESMRLNSAGNMGIGETSIAADTRLHLKQTTDNCILKVQSSFGSILNLINGGGSEVSTINATGNNVLTVQTGSTERMRITSAGDVAIGNTSALTTSANRRVLTLNGTTDAMYNIGIGGTYTAFFYSNASGTQLGSATSIPLQFYTSDTERMRIDSSGNLLVGTTSVQSSAKVSITGNTSNSTDAAFVTLKGTGENIGSINYDNAFGTMVRLTGTKQGSGGEADEGRFSVITAVNSILTGGVQISGGGTSWSSISDERQKTDLKIIENAITKVSTLRAVTGRYKTDKEGVSRAFLIAQDVQKVQPEAVVEIEQDGKKLLGLAYTEVIPLLVASIKELKSELDSVKAELQTLKGN